MPWAPQDEDWVGDPRLDPFRQRAGALLDAGEQVGHTFLRVLETWVRVSGHLWWSRWDPAQEVVHVHLLLGDGLAEEWVTSGERLEADLADWRDDVFRQAGRTYRVEWQDDEESVRVRREVFGLS